MTANVGFIFHSAEGYSRIFSSHGKGDILCDGGFAHSGRARKADYLPLDVRRKLANRKQLQNTLFDLIKSIVVLIKLLFRFF